MAAVQRGSSKSNEMETRNHTHYRYRAIAWIMAFFAGWFFFYCLIRFAGCTIQPTKAQIQAEPAQIQAIPVKTMDSINRAHAMEIAQNEMAVAMARRRPDLVRAAQYRIDSIWREQRIHDYKGKP